VFSGETTHEVEVLPILEIRCHDRHVRACHGGEAHSLVWIGGLARHPRDVRVQASREVRSVRSIRIH
jgi:hypothetical protein